VEVVLNAETLTQYISVEVWNEILSLLSSPVQKAPPAGIKVYKKELPET